LQAKPRCARRACRAAFHVAAWANDRRAVECHAAGGRREQASRNPQSRRLAATRRADEADDFAAGDFKINLLQNLTIGKGEIDFGKADERGAVAARIMGHERPPAVSGSGASG
jgi:hypothetical protein